MFLLMTKMERRSSILPLPAPYPGSPLCLQNKVCLGHWSPSADGDRLQGYSPFFFFFFCTDRWCTSPLSRSPAADRRILTSPVPASPTNPMRRLILSPSPLTQSEYNGLSSVPAAVRRYLASLLFCFLICSQHWMRSSNLHWRREKPARTDMRKIFQLFFKAASACSHPVPFWWKTSHYKASSFS